MKRRSGRLLKRGSKRCGSWLCLLAHFVPVHYELGFYCSQETFDPSTDYFLKMAQFLQLVNVGVKPVLSDSDVLDSDRYKTSPG